MPVETRQARVEDACYLARNLRPSDLAEVLALLGEHGDVARAIRHSILASPISGVALFEGKPMFIIGCAQGDGDVGQPWLLATDEVEKHPKAMTRITKQYIKRFQDRWPVLLNYVDARHDASVRWLKRLGFTVEKTARPLGTRGEPFYQFSMGA